MAKTNALAENISQYWRHYFAAHPKSLRVRSNEAAIAQWQADHPGASEIPPRVLNRLTNPKSLLRKARGANGKRGRPRQDALSATGMAGRRCRIKNFLSLILGGGRAARLYPLPRRRSEPAVPLAGKYRLIDVPVSNCLNSGLNRVYVLTQFLSVSLHRHLATTYKTGPFLQGFVKVLAAQQTNETTNWYTGTADALRQNLRYIESEDPADVLVLSCDHVYRMHFH